MILINVESVGVLQLSIWQPEDLFQSPISLTIDGLSWPLIYGAVTVLLSVILTAATRPQAEHADLRSFWFLYTSFAVIAIMSANLLTTAIAWAMMDFGTVIFLLSISENQQDRRAIFVRAGVNAVSVLLIIAAAMTSQIQGIVALDLTKTSAIGIMMLAIAASLRLGLMPLHFALPPFAPLRRDVGTLLRLLPPVVALALLARVFAAGLPEVLRVVFIIAGCTGGILGAVRWFLQEEIVEARPYFVLAQAGLGIIIATIAGGGAQIIVASGLIILLVGAVISLYAQHTPSHRIIPIIASVLLLGVPFTPGGVYATAVANPETFMSAPVVSVISIIITALLTLGCFHLFFTQETRWPIGESLARVMFNLGLALPLMVAIGVGIWRMRTDPLRGLFFPLAALILSGAMFLLFRSLSLERIDRIRVQFKRFDPNPIYEALWTILQKLLVSIRGLGEIFEGFSGMLWLFVFVIVVLFIVQ
ncbi:MAG: hypothetical protein PVI04_03175 [Anaerolineales bacterium]|jgi:hypothetical protein